LISKKCTISVKPYPQIRPMTDPEHLCGSTGQSAFVFAMSVSPK
jgi:hypothetical protein